MPVSKGSTNLPLLQKSGHVGIIVIADVLLLFPRRWGGFARRVGRADPRRRKKQQVRGKQKQEDRAHPGGGRHVSHPPEPRHAHWACADSAKSRSPAPPPAFKPRPRSVLRRTTPSTRPHPSPTFAHSGARGSASHPSVAYRAPPRPISSRRPPPEAPPPASGPPPQICSSSGSASSQTPPHGSRASPGCAPTVPPLVSPYRLRPISRLRPTAPPLSLAKLSNLAGSCWTVLLRLGAVRGGC